MFHDRIFRPVRKRACIVFQFTVMLALTVTGAEGQERQYNIGPSVDVVAGSDSHPVNNVAIPLPSTSNGQASFFRLYPAISLTSDIAGESTSSDSAESALRRSHLNATYALEWAGTRNDVDYNTLSHSASLAFLRPVGAKWRLNLTETFLASSNAAAFNGLRGSSLPADQFRFLFDPVALQVSTHSNVAGIVAEYILDPRSILSMTAGDNLRTYGNGASQSTSFSNQQFITGGFNYTQKTTARDSWSAGYTAGYVSFEKFGNSTSHTFHVGYTASVTNDTTLELTVGLSRAEGTSAVGNTAASGTGGVYVGYNTSVILSRTKLNDSFSVRYRQDSGQPTGLGSVSNIRQLGLSAGYKLKTISLFGDASIFDAQGTLGNTLQTRGASATASVGFPLTQTLSINGGAQYQRYAMPAPLGFTEERFFVSLKYNAPKLWTIFR